MWRTLLASSLDEALPERVRGQIRRQQDAAERLIGFIQLAVVATFGALYVISTFVRQRAADAAFELAPWAIGLYLAFTLMRVALSYRRSLPDWLLMISIVVDMALLMVLIWSFHLQYHQPPSFYLKAPTLLYVFIFISLRTLRFEPRFVAAAGVMAALGWGALVLYAVTRPDGDMMITRDYVEYMTTNAILIGAEFDKVASILTVTVILVVAQLRARRMLISAVAEGQAAQDLSRFFDDGMARRITGAEAQIAAGEGEARDAAIVFFDVRGFSRMATEVAPSALIALLTDYQALVAPVIHRHRGAIDKYLGDGVMVTFGAATPNQTYAADALRALDDALRDIDAWNARRAARGETKLEVNAAAAAGRIVFGAVGDESRLEYTVIGDAVNLAAKLEKHNKNERARALTTQRLYDIALAQGYTRATPPEPRAGRRVQGVSDPVDIVVLA